MLIVGGETAVYVVDRATNNVILVVAIVLVGLGLLLFTWLRFSKRLLCGLARILVLAFMAVHLALFAILAVVPPVRIYAMAFTGVGLQQRLAKVSDQPRIVEVVPRTIILGETREIVGNRLGGAEEAEKRSLRRETNHNYMKGVCENGCKIPIRDFGGGRQQPQ